MEDTYPTPQKAKPPFSRSCNHCSRYVVIPLYEGEIKACHWLGSTQVESKFVYTDNICITFPKGDGTTQKETAHLFRLKPKRSGYCEFYKEK